MTWPTREEMAAISFDANEQKRAELEGGSLEPWVPLAHITSGREHQVALAVADAILARFEPWRLAQNVECATHGCQFTTVAQQRNEAHAALEAASEWAAALDAMDVNLMTGQERMVFNALRAARADLALALPLARAALDCYEGRMLAPIVEIVERMTPDEWARLRGTRWLLRRTKTGRAR